MMPTTATGGPRWTGKKMGRIGYSISLAASRRKLTPESTTTLRVSHPRDGDSLLMGGNNGASGLAPRATIASNRDSNGRGGTQATYLLYAATHSDVMACTAVARGKWSRQTSGCKRFSRTSFFLA